MKGHSDLITLQNQPRPSTCLHILGRATMRSRTLKTQHNHQGNGHHAAVHHVGWQDATSRDGSATGYVLSAVNGEVSGIVANKTVGMSGRGRRPWCRGGRSAPFLVPPSPRWFSVMGRASRSGGSGAPILEINPTRLPGAWVA